jgi:hypothetical protein
MSKATIDLTDGDGEDDSMPIGYDPAVAQAPGVDGEQGPDPEGAPAAEWADGYDEPPAAEVEAMLNGEEEAIFGDPPLIAPDSGDLGVRVAAAHANLVRMNFPREFADSDWCAACGRPIEDHDPEVCAGGTPQSRAKKSRKNRSGAQAADPESTGVSGESPVLGDPTHPGVTVPRSEGFPPTATENLPPPNVNGNGGHDKDDAAGILLDPVKVTQTLRECGVKITHDGQTYHHPDGLPVYSNEWVEAEYRSALAGRAR